MGPHRGLRRCVHRGRAMEDRPRRRWQRRAKGDTEDTGDAGTCEAQGCWDETEHAAVMGLGVTNGYEWLMVANLEWLF